MIISHRLKYVFIHIPKTGGTSMRNILTHNYKFSCDVISIWDGCTPEQLASFPRVTDELRCHYSIDKAKSYFKKYNLDWGEYFKFSIMRNPYDLHVSNYHYLNQVIKNKKDITENEIQACENADTFENYIHNLKNTGGLQHQYIMDGGEIGVDFIGKLENIKNDFKHIVNSIVPSSVITEEEYKLPKLNTTNRRKYSEYYTPELISIVNDVCAKDFEVGGYKMS